MKEVIVQLAPSATGHSPLDAPFETARNFGLTLKAIHPQSDDPTLARWFHVQIDNAKAAEFVQRLRNIPEVTAAYVKPPAEVP
jgi:hypothetical protein